MEITSTCLADMPKIELHVHLESRMPGDMLEQFAARQGKQLPRPAGELYHCSADDLSNFLAFLDSICAYVGRLEELSEVAEQAALESRRENIL